jgi:hypothetical protein
MQQPFHQKGRRLLDILDTAVFDFLIGLKHSLSPSYFCLYLSTAFNLNGQCIHSLFIVLLGNADRHHYETFEKDGDSGMLLLLDNAKSFGNAKHDEWSILAPIYQCCKIRRSTWTKLQELSRGAKSLGSLLKGATSVDSVAPVLTDEHFGAVDRRLGKVTNLITQCIEKLGPNAVLTEDILS